MVGGGAWLTQNHPFHNAFAVRHILTDGLTVDPYKIPDMASRKQRRPARRPVTRRPRPAIARAAQGLQREIDRLSVVVEALEKHHAINLRRFAELQLEIDRLKSGSGASQS